MQGTGSFQPDAPNALKPDAGHGREGSYNRGGMYPSVLRGSPPLVANAIGPSPTLTPSAVQDDLNAADLLEGDLNLGQEKRPFGRDDGIPRPDMQPSSGTGRADPVGNHRVRGIPVA
jgi:hypothetical protein